ncbi:MAG: phage tail tape measure protein [Pseudolabrys sp.]
MATRILDAEAVLRARDLSGATMDRFADKVARINRAAQSLSRDIDRISLDGFAGRAGRMAARLDAIGDRAVRVGRNLTYGVTLPAAIAGRSILHNLHNFELASNKIKAFGDVSEDELKRLRDLAKNLGSKYAFGPTGVMEGFVEAIKAGFVPNQLPAIAKPLLDFATIAEIDVPRAAELAIFSLSSFGKMYDQTGALLDDGTLSKNLREMVDLFAILNKVAPGSIGQIAETFKYSAPAAAQLKLPPQQLGALTAVLNQAGILGPEAGVALRSMMVRFLKPTRPALAALSATGMRLDDYILRNPSLLKPEAILSAVEQQTGTLSAEQRALFRSRVARLNTASGEDYEKGLLAAIRGTGGAGLQDAKVAGDLATRIMGTAVEKIDVMRFLKDAAAKAPNLAAFMAQFMDQRQAVRLANLYNARVTKLLDDIEGELQRAREGGVPVSQRQAETRNSGIIKAENELRGAWQNFTQALGDSGVTQAATSTMNALASGLRSIGDLNPRILEFSTYAAAAAASAGPLVWMTGKLASAAGGIASAIGWLVPAGATAGAAAKAAGAGGVAGASLATIYAILGYENYKNMRGTLDRLPESLMRAGVIPADRDFAPAGMRALTVDQVLASLGGGKDITAELKGSATLENRVVIEASPEFAARVQQAVRNEINALRINGAPSSGTAGDLGVSMPDAGPMP